MLTFFDGCQQVLPFCQNKHYHGPLFNDGTIGKRSVHVCIIIASARLIKECWAMYVETCQNRVTTGYNRLAAVGGWYSLNSQIVFTLLIALVKSKSRHKNMK
jgi:hypothetical protein